MIYARVYDLCERLVMIAPPYHAFVEQPFAPPPRRPPPVSYYVVGAVQGAIFNALSEVWAYPVSVETVAVTQWKSEALNDGNAGKPKIMKHARELGYEGDIQDEADAIGIAMACEKMVRPAEMVG